MKDDKFDRRLLEKPAREKGLLAELDQLEAANNRCFALENRIFELETILFNAFFESRDVADTRKQVIALRQELARIIADEIDPLMHKIVWEGTPYEKYSPRRHP